MSDEITPALTRDNGVSGRVHEILGNMIGLGRKSELLRVLYDAGCGRDALVAALLPGKLRMGCLLPEDALEAVHEVDAFLALAGARSSPRG